MKWEDFTLLIYDTYNFLSASVKRAASWYDKNILLLFPHSMTFYAWKTPSMCELEVSVVVHCEQYIIRPKHVTKLHLGNIILNPDFVKFSN